MAKSVSYKCDQCGAVKGDANHWWKVGLPVRENGVPLNRLIVLPWEEHYGQESDWPTVQHLCGESCVQAVVGKFLAGKMSVSVERG